MTHSIGFAVPATIPALKELWIRCFGDEGGYTEFMFASLLTPERILAVTDTAGEPLAMACMQPFTFAAEGQEADGIYLYGVATATEQRGKGLSTALLEECHRLLTERRIALSVLVPASESLFGFYGARGYEAFASLQKAIATGASLPPVPPYQVAPADLDSLAGMRDRFYRGRAYVKWDGDYLRYIGTDCRTSGGDVLLLTAGEESGYAICYPTEKRIVVKEIVMAEELLPNAAAAILARFDGEECLLYLPAETRTPFPNKVLPSAMVRWYDKEKQRLMAGGPPYITHVLDD